MGRTARTAVLLVLLALAAGCAGLPAWRPAEAPRPGPAPAERAPAEEERGRPERGATVALLADADALQRAGELDRAAAVLERAVRISPNDPLPWHRLAAVRLAQRRAAQAEQLARKSNLLVGEDRTLRARNWRIVAEARRLSGDEAGARIAEQKAAELE